MKKPLWHRLSQVEQEFILKQGFTVAEFMERYEQPAWCMYPEALGGTMGCWSLMTPRLIKKRKDCEECDCCEGSDAFKAEQEATKRLIAIQRRNLAIEK